MFRIYKATLSRAGLALLPSKENPNIKRWQKVSEDPQPEQATKTEKEDTKTRATKYLEASQELTSETEMQKYIDEYNSRSLEWAENADLLPDNPAYTVDFAASQFAEKMVDLYQTIIDTIGFEGYVDAEAGSISSEDVWDKKSNLSYYREKRDKFEESLDLKREELEERQEAVDDAKENLYDIQEKMEAAEETLENLKSDLDFIMRAKESLRTGDQIGSLDNFKSKIQKQEAIVDDLEDQYYEAKALLGEAEDDYYYVSEEYNSEQSHFNMYKHYADEAKYELENAKEQAVEQKIKVNSSMGELERSLESGGFVLKNDWFEIDSRFRGKGMAAQLYAMQEDYMRKVYENIDDNSKSQVRIDILADISVGKYYWAKQGFMYTNDSSRMNHMYNMRDTLDSYEEALKSDRADRLYGFNLRNSDGERISFKDSGYTVEMINEFRDFLDSNRNTLEPIDVAEYNPPSFPKDIYRKDNVSGTLIPMKFGKMLLLDSYHYNVSKPVFPESATRMYPRGVALAEKAEKVNARMYAKQKMKDPESYSWIQPSDDAQKSFRIFVKSMKAETVEEVYRNMQNTDLSATSEAQKQIQSKMRKGTLLKDVPVSDYASYGIFSDGIYVEDLQLLDEADEG